VSFLTGDVITSDGIGKKAFFNDAKAIQNLYICLFLIPIIPLKNT